MKWGAGHIAALILAILEVLVYFVFVKIWQAFRRRNGKDKKVK